MRKLTVLCVILLVPAVLAGAGYLWLMHEFHKTPSATYMEVKSKAPTQVANARLDVWVQSFTTPVMPGKSASMTVKTGANAHCTIEVIYDKGKSTDPALTQKLADEEGIASWTWTVPAATPEGQWPVRVTCVNSLKKSSTVRGDLEVVKTLPPQSGSTPAN